MRGLTLLLAVVGWRLQTCQSWVPAPTSGAPRGLGARRWSRIARVAPCGAHRGASEAPEDGSRRSLVLGLAAGLGSALLPRGAAAAAEQPDGAGGPDVADGPKEPDTPGDGLAADFPRVTVPYKGKDLPLTKFMGKATVVVNVKTDDPEAVKQYPALA